ncbi:hypothetical protein PPYR_03391 [Photinus pyralis]|uniref:Uncharacterized protein n=1 Tax=Photinus pyralis TaxID=7054 RepID=A0A5N4A2R3_PHOPY|nr:ABC transporter G family member 23-like isoform X2 [Photinus pyralis]KAB0791591.1 hypothetical protein PPYR_03391 [Photinus pyralis]
MPADSALTRLDEPKNAIEIEPDVDLASNAVVVRGAFKSYGSFKVLRDFNMTVPRGGIYGLLGASGCGKTTLLECLIGRKRLNSGDIYVLGQKIPDAQNEQRIGYMPQKIGLYGDLTVEETLLFFGRVIEMKDAKIKERTEYLTELLDLRRRNVRLKHMSGGQQRRVSLAVAFLHEPELLILDEPTVGVDTVLRQLIWDHFLDLVHNGTVTVIITTHYIEETLQANLVGIMRKGCLIAEDTPKRLLREHEASSLEMVFLKLSVLQNQAQRRTSERVVEPLGSRFASKIDKAQRGWSLRGSHMRALIWKNAIWFRKNWRTFARALVLPVVMLSIYCAAIGHNPVEFPISVVNLETGPRNCSEHELRCDDPQLSCAFLNVLSRRKLVMKFYASEDVAMETVQKGESYASLTIKANYSKAIAERVSDWNRATDAQIDGATIDVFRDVSNSYMSLYMQVMLYQTFETFLYEYAQSCGLRKDLVKVPLRWGSLYEWMDTDFTDFTIPGALPLIVFTISILLTALAMYVERNEAGLERILVAGINKIELILSHIIVEAVALLPQIVFMMVFAFLVFNMTIKGSVVLTAILLYLAGILGICYGMFLSCAFKSQIAIALVTTGTYFIMVFTCGIVWPIQGMHPLLKKFSPYFPLTLPTDSLRNILHRNWDFFRPEVYVGFLSLGAWSLIFLLLSLIVIRIQRE